MKLDKKAMMIGTLGYIILGVIALVIVITLIIGLGNNSFDLIDSIFG